ncbi:MAG: hypothetical protein CML66_26465 [Rhodobacteraceae bacterium]|nr:hypothetical protein [Paracoccaceae bacterium]MAY44188.1 hypothetical protein [Paracoccaceae bacterium]|tara:strand:+ start:239 stop:529 length:291 start_codon:yes stop_codon:yes gene_type:complete
MTGQSRRIDAILSERLRATQDIARANTEQLRLNQKARGMMVLDMKDARDGVQDSERDAETARNNAALDRNLDHIRQLEDRLLALDEELAAAVRKET